jgi:hypothetical protein
MATQIKRKDSGKSGVPAEAAEIVASLQGILGNRILAAMTGAADVTVVEAWARSEVEPPSEVANLLKLAWEAVELLLEVEQPSVIRAFFGGLNPLLGDRPPALVLAEDPDAFRRAVREFRAYG